MTEETKAEVSVQPAPESAELRRATVALLKGESIEDVFLLSDLLQRATEQLNPLIARAEKALAALRLNIPVSVRIAHDPDTKWSTYVSFRKAGRDWGLHLDSGRDDAPSQHWEAVRLHNASREMRLEALAKLPELEKALVEEAAQQCAHAVRVVSDAAGYLNALEGRKA